jgi:hypothetical protein
MRYHAKVYVSDVMDQVVVSGYVMDTDSHTNPDHETYEFSYQAPGVGLDDEHAWLLNSLYRALVSNQRPATEGR